MIKFNEWLDIDSCKSKLLSSLRKSMYRDALSETLSIWEFKFTLHLITKYLTQNHYGQEEQI